MYIIIYKIIYISWYSLKALGLLKKQETNHAMYIKISSFNSELGNEFFVLVCVCPPLTCFEIMSHTQLMSHEYISIC